VLPFNNSVSKISNANFAQDPCAFFRDVESGLRFIFLGKYFFMQLGVLDEDLSKSFCLDELTFTFEVTPVGALTSMPYAFVSRP